MRMIQAAIFLLCTATAGAADDPKLTPEDHPCENVSTVTYQIGECLKDAVTRADRALNQIYTLLMKGLTAGTIPNSSSVLFEEKRKDLLQAERAWEKYTEAQCLVEGELLAPGTGIFIETEHCVLLLTNERIRFLVRYEEQISSDSNLCQHDEAKCALPDAAP